jgi:hypothetical protein
MNILYLNNTEPEYQADAILKGLYQLGHNILEYPYRKEKFVHFNIDSSLRNGQELGAPPSTSREDVEYLLNSNFFNLCVVASQRETVQSIIPWYAKQKRPYTILLDGEDGAALTHSIVFKREDFFDIIFKREYINKHSKKKVHPLSFCSDIELTNEILGSPQLLCPTKEYDIVFLVNDTHEDRHKVNLILENPRLKDYRIINKVSGGLLPKPEYYDVMNKSKVAISIRGRGYDTNRYWEIAALRYTTLISDRATIKIHNNFINNDSCYQFKNGRELIERLEYLIKNDFERERLNKKKWEVLNTYHTTEKRAQEMLTRAGF